MCMIYVCSMPFVAYHMEYVYGPCALVGHSFAYCLVAAAHREYRERSCTHCIQLAPREATMVGVATGAIHKGGYRKIRNTREFRKLTKK